MKLGLILFASTLIFGGQSARAQQGVSDGANQARIMNGASAAANTSNAIISFKAGTKAGWPGGVPFFLASAASTVQAGFNIHSMRSAKNACKQVSGLCTDPTGPGGDPVIPTYPPLPNWPGGENDDDGDNDQWGSKDDWNPAPADKFNPDRMERVNNRVKEALKRIGVEVLPDGSVKTPKGVASPAMLGSGKALADAGLIPASQIALYDQTMKENMNKIKVMSASAPAGGYSNSYGGGSKSRSDDVPSYDPYAAYSGHKEEPKAAATSGLSKNFGNDPVGIASDDLFQMVSRRYRALDEKKTFVGP